MKTLTLVSVLLAATVTMARGAVCTFDDVDMAASKPEVLNANAMCYVLKGELPDTPSDAQTNAYCEKNRGCIDAMTAAVEAMPECTVQGTSIRETFRKNQESLIDECRKVGAKVDSGASTQSASLAATAVALVFATYSHT